uniref:Double-stranded RNA-binding protein Staufen homolog 2 n=1 Tax=Oryzias latipes TaxID=8090 RepID=H2LV37_ORYLA
MAQVKVQTTAPLAGPGLSAGVPPAAMASPGPLGLQPSVNGTGSAPAPACPAPAVGYGDAPVSVTPPGSSQPDKRSSFLLLLIENMANPKEKTPMCLVNELARFNRMQPQYKLLNERGPAHAKIFTVQLTLGEQVWEAEGTSIKKAQHSTAAKALAESVLPRPAPRSPKVDINSNPGSITPTVELNGLAMKRGEPAIYRPLDPKPMPNYRANYNFRGMFNQRYHYPIPKIFYVQLSVGSHEFIGEGRTRQAARHNAAMKALQALRNEPIPERSSHLPAEEGTDASKSEISLVYEIALKRNLSVNFEVLKESGPPHMKSFLTRVTVGEFSAEGEGNSKKLSKKRAALSILQELKKLPFIPTVEKPKTHYKKRTKTILKTGPDYGQGMNPISRLAQIQQAKKEKEPEYQLLSERGIPRRREFVMQVKVNNEVATGAGPNKKVAKRNAAEAMLLQLGYKASTAPQNPTEVRTLKSSSQKGLLHLSPDVYQEMEASRKQSASSGGNSGGSVNFMTSKDMVSCSAPLPPGHSSYYNSSSSSPSPTASMARELLLNGQSPTTDTSLSMKGKNLACGVSVQPAQQLDYLARIQGFQVQYSDAQSGKDFVTYLTLSPVQMTFHGTGSTLQASHDQVWSPFAAQNLNSLEGVTFGVFSKPLHWQ